MSKQELYQYWRNNVPSPFAGMAENIMAQINEHVVTDADILEMQAVGFKIKEVNLGYIVILPKSMPTNPYYVKVFVEPKGAWHEAWVDYSVRIVIPRIVNTQLNIERQRSVIGDI